MGSFGEPRSPMLFLYATNCLIKVMRPDQRGGHASDVAEFFVIPAVTV